jgi:hypothetical protein
MPDGYGFLAVMQAVETSEPVLRRFLRSPLPIASLLSVLGAAAIAPALVVARNLVEVAGVEELAAPALLMLFVSVPLAIAGALAIAGGVLMLKLHRLGKILATIAIAIAVLYPLMAAATNLLTISACGPTERDCANRWFNVVTTLGGAAILGSLVAAVWYARLERVSRRPKG